MTFLFVILTLSLSKGKTPRILLTVPTIFREVIKKSYPLSAAKDPEALHQPRSHGSFNPGHPPLVAAPSAPPHKPVAPPPPQSPRIPAPAAPPRVRPVPPTAQTRSAASAPPPLPPPPTTHPSPSAYGTRL